MSPMREVEKVSERGSDKPERARKRHHKSSERGFYSPGDLVERKPHSQPIKYKGKLLKPSQAGLGIILREIQDVDVYGKTFPRSAKTDFYGKPKGTYSFVEVHWQKFDRKEVIHKKYVQKILEIVKV